ncbi:MAG: hypothetical protein LBF38_03080 [Deltaproteobacteria bacterium]|jgi:hypothetical protein|nr:hypothetical protein [Deltaproteobacteria bacterium]
MFKKLFSKANNEEKSILYSSLDFLLASLSRLVELTALLLLASGLADKLANVYVRPFSEKPLELLLLAPMIVFITLAASICPAIRARLRTESGLDTRSLKAKLAIVLPYWIFGFFYLWLVSWLLLQNMNNGQLIIWTFTLATSLWALIVLEAVTKHLEIKAKLREMTAEEFPEGLHGFFEKWQKNEGGKLMVCQNFGPGLTMPTYQGKNLIVTEKALAAFQPESLKAGLIMAMVSQMLKLKRNYIILRLVAITMAVPASMMLLYSLGYMMGYPLVVRVSNVALVWLGCWLSFHVSNLVMNFISRILIHRLNLATIAIMGQIMPLIKAIETMSQYNLLPKKAPWWKVFGSPYPGPKDQIRAIMNGLGDPAVKGAKKAAAKPQDLDQAQAQGEEIFSEPQKPDSNGQGAAKEKVRYKVSDDSEENNYETFDNPEDQDRSDD